MPMSWAAALSSEQARMALPILDLEVNHMSTTMIKMQARMVTRDTAETLNCAKNAGTGNLTSEVKFLGVAPHSS